MKNLLFVIFLLVLSTKSFALTQGATTFVGPVGIGTTATRAGLSVMNGNVGLGTWNPSNILDVVGGVGIGTSGADIYVTSTVPVGELVVEKNVGIGTIAPNKSLCVGSTCQAYIDSSGNGFYTGSLTTTYNTLDNGSGAGHFAGGLTTQFNTLDNGTTGGAYFKGNLGIGSATPGQALDVQGIVRATNFSGAGTNLTGLPSSGGVLTTVTTVTAGATPTIVAVDNTNYEITGLATAITNMSTNLSGTTTNGAMIEIDITDNGTAMAITWGTSFESTTVTLPTTTVISTRLRIYFQYNSTASKWDCVGTA